MSEYYLMVHDCSLNETEKRNSLYDGDKTQRHWNLPLAREAKAEYSCPTILNRRVIGVVDGSENLIG